MKWRRCLQLSSKFVGTLFQIYWNLHSLFHCISNPSYLVSIHATYFQATLNNIIHILIKVIVKVTTMNKKCCTQSANALHSYNYLYILKFILKLPFLTLNCLDSCSNNDYFLKNNIALRLFGNICAFGKNL